MLNSRELSNFITGPLGEKNIQQVGIDLNLMEVARIDDRWKDCGAVLVDETKLPRYSAISPESVSGIDGESWVLTVGVYSIVFTQGCDIPCDTVLFIRQRSSLLRCGTIIHSSVFDPGFKTKHIGCVMIVHAPIIIEVGARVAQIYGHKCSEVAVEDLYGNESKGSQFQNDNQRDANTKHD
ncbi:MAG: hypothetical protein JHC54_12045 [Acinetobacter sp.]|nr:hypothetical protein [Acinetobacter sp.]